jgi:uncharacterized protein
MARTDSSESINKKARAAENKPAAIGVDLDLSKFEREAEPSRYETEAANLPEAEKEKLFEVGVVTEGPRERSGTFIQTDNTPVHISALQEGIEVMATSEALKKYDWLHDYMWKAVAVDTDKYTAAVELGQWDGYFFRALPGQKTEFPVQACLYLAKSQLAQKVHNIIIAEPGSELHIITGCTTAHRDEPGLHMGVSEFYIKKGAKVTFTMIHAWNPETHVRPRTGVIVEEGGTYLSNYVIMRPVLSVQTNPTCHCIGANSIARFNSVQVATPGSTLDIGSRVFLNGPGSRSEIIARTLTTGGTIINRGYIEGNAPGIKGHLECRGLILSEKGIIHSIPELKGTLAGIDLSHEAAVGKIAEEEVEYLMARGLTRNEATATIVRGFLNVDIEGLPPMLAAEMKRAITESEKDLM